MLQDATVTGITLTRDNVTLAGLGADQTKIVITQNVWAQGGIFLNGANGITIEGLTIELTDTSARAAVIKATFNSDGETDYSDLSENVTLRDLVLIGNESSGGGINLHGVKNVVVDSVRIENKYGVGISLAYATDVEISNVTFTNESGWGDIGMMYAADNPDYVVPVKGVTLGEGIEFAMYRIYAEKAEYELDYSAYADQFGLIESAEGWLLTNTIAASITKDGVTVNYATVQGAINAAEAGDVVEIAAGTFDEALVINKSITVKGAANGETVIAGPADYSSIQVVTAAESGNSSDLYAIVLVTGGAEVTLQDLTVQGKIDQFQATYGKGTVVGVAVCNASLAAEDVNVYDITIAESDDANYFGVQRGSAVLASATVADTYTVSFTGGEVTGFQKGGFVIRSNIKLFTLRNATVLGCGATPLIAQNAVQVACDSVIEGNTLGNVEYTGEADDSSAALLTVDMLANGKTLNGYAFALNGDNTNMEEAVLAANTFRNSQVNISVYGTQSAAARNATTGVLYNSAAEAIAAASANDVVEVISADLTAPLQITVSMTIRGAGDGATLNFENCAAIQIMADVDLTLENITLFTNDAQGTEGGANAGIACGAGNLTVNQAVNLTLKNVMIDGFDYGIYLWAANSADNKMATIAADNLTVQNSLVKGIYAENLTDSTFTDCEFLNNGTNADEVNDTFKPWVSGVDINLKYGDYENIAFTNCTFEGNGDNDGAALLLKARDDGDTYGANPATLTGVTVRGCTFTGNHQNIILGELNANNRGPENVTIDDESLITNDYRLGRSISTVEQLTEALAAANNGDTLYLTSGHFALPSTQATVITIDKSITIVGATEEEAVYANDVVTSSGAVPVTSGTLFTRAEGDGGVTNLITVDAENVTFRNLTFDASVFNDDGTKTVNILLMVQQNGFVGENLYFNNVQNNGLQLNHGNNAKLTNIGGSVYLSDEDYAPTVGGDMVVVKVVASTGVTIDGLTVDFAGGYALMTFQQEVSVTVTDLTVTNGAAAIYMEIPAEPFQGWQESWGSFFGDQTVTLEGTLTLGTDVELSEISDANAGDEYTATVTNNATNA